MMTLRNAVLGLAVMFAFSVWSACRSGSAAQVQNADPVLMADEAESCEGGNHDAAIHRFRTNQSTHWRQVAIGNH
jgi:hypothetical protein